MLSISTRTIARAATLAGLGGTLVGCASDAAGPSAGGDGAAAARRAAYSAWSPALTVELAPPGAHSTFNTAFLDGCPLTSRDGKQFFIASTRPGGLGGIDIWVSSREHVDDPWGPPVNL